MIHPLKHVLLCSALTPVLLSVAANPAGADILADEGQHAMLSVSITVEGKVEKPGGYRDEVVKWSTQRAFNATVEMVADEPQTMSFSETVGGGDGTGQSPLADMQKQLEACGQDQACQMQVAMQMANSPAMQQIAAAPPRYQAWRVMEGGAPLDVSGSYEETVHTVFYTGARETTDCTLTAPKVSPELSGSAATPGQNWSKQSREMLEDSARAFIIEVDGAGKTGVLTIGSVLAIGYGDIQCSQNIGSGLQTSHHSTTATLLPASESSSFLQARGTAAGNAVIASGSATFEQSQELKNLGEAFPGDVVAPVKVAVRWELKKI